MKLQFTITLHDGTKEIVKNAAYWEITAENVLTFYDFLNPDHPYKRAVYAPDTWLSVQRDEQ
jgi:hypothetical protein